MWCLKAGCKAEGLRVRLGIASSHLCERHLTEIERDLQMIHHLRDVDKARFAIELLLQTADGGTKFPEARNCMNHLVDEVEKAEQATIAYVCSWEKTP